MRLYGILCRDLKINQAAVIMHVRSMSQIYLLPTILGHDRMTGLYFAFYSFCYDEYWSKIGEFVEDADNCYWKEIRLMANGEN